MAAGTNAAPVKVGAILPAGGQGLRLGGAAPKQFLPLAGRPVLEHTLEHFKASGLVDTAVLVVPQSEVESARRQFARFEGWLAHVVAGGAERQDSVRNGLEALAGDAQIVLVHDGVRPFVTPRMIRDSITAAREHGAAICAVPVHDTLKRADDAGLVLETVDRDGLWRVQTPQTFQRRVLEDAFARATAEGFYGTDEGMLVERLGLPVKLIAGSQFNIKITRPEDLALAERIAAFWPDVLKE